MKLHGNARTCPKSRKLLVERIGSGGWSAAAKAAGVSDRTAYRWLRRWRQEGDWGLVDRSSAPRSIPHRTSSMRVAAIDKLRRLRFRPGDRGAALDGAVNGVGHPDRIGMGKLDRLGLEPAGRYERERPGELVHLDIKKLGRISGVGKRVTGRRALTGYRDRKARGEVGWEFVHVAVDDATRLAYAEVLPNEQGQTAADFLRRAAAWFATLGIRVERVMSDNGPCYRSRALALARRELGIARQLFTRPYIAIVEQRHHEPGRV